MTEFSELKGKTILAVLRQGDEELHFHVEGGVYRMYHHQSCCENVEIEDINGDLNTLVGSPVLFAEESSHHAEEGYNSDTWTFYKLATVKGWVDIRWHGSSNGCYSEEVDIEFIPE